MLEHSEQPQGTTRGLWATAEGPAPGPGAGARIHAARPGLCPAGGRGGRGQAPEGLGARSRFKHDLRTGQAWAGMCVWEALLGLWDTVGKAQGRGSWGPDQGRHVGRFRVLGRRDHRTWYGLGRAGGGEVKDKP